MTRKLLINVPGIITKEPATAKTGSGFVINDVAELHEYNKRKCAFEKGKFACVSSSLLY
jgi:hypothetical protein